MIEHDYNVYFTDLFKFYTDETRTEVNKNGKEILKQNVDFLSEANFPNGKDPYTLLLKEIDRIEPERIIIFGNKSEKNIKANIYSELIKLCNEKDNDIIEIDESIIKENKYIPWNKKINVLYEDDDLLIVYKPINMLVHPDGNSNETLVNAVSNYYKGKNIIFEHLHRLDFETSGMIIFSKNILAHSYMSNLWENHDVLKQYICLCHNHFSIPKGTINKKIASDRHSNKQIISQGGKDAKTIYKVLEEINNISKVNVQIEGGRRHQIRVHLSSIHHPIVGDKLYGIDDKSSRMMLQFYKVGFVHPRTFEYFKFEIEQEF